MKKLMCIAMLVPFLALVGCKALGPSDGQSQAALDAYRAFVAQQRSYDSIRIVGTAEHPAKLTMEGTEITVSSALPALSAMGSDDTRARIAEQIASIMRFGIGALGAYGVVKAAQGDSIFSSSETAGTTP